MTGSGSVPEPPPPSAGVVFGPRLPLAEDYARLLSGSGVVRGVIGPREPERIWSRHLLNCAVMAGLFPEATRVVDVGTGAGLPGIALAIARSDLQVDLVEPLQRRVDFLVETVAALGLSARVRVVRGRAEDPAVRAEVGSAPWVTARAVARLDRLVRWCLPLLAPDGRLALLKGASAAEEVQQDRRAMDRAGAGPVEILSCGAGVVDPPAQVIIVGMRPVDELAGRGTRKGKR